MAIVRWRPFRELNTLQREMNRMFESFFRDFEEESGGELAWYPSIDVKETNDKVEVFAELPGMRKEDIKVSVRDNVLQISGEKKREEEEKDANYHRIERVYGTFSRTITLPAHVEIGKVEAYFKDGVLRLTLPKAEEEKPRQIEIK
ncbi:MAG: Hsp20/alpha crystallin family protein [candidate division KSB1 bacterium]|nr:Hsp20/alpha crystallin family protein [candidate division KSB1 bacterium]MDZ7371472.1 Hsp20/alpha crystallin family protein [candidate division KSB1 bacterium]